MNSAMKLICGIAWGLFIGSFWVAGVLIRECMA